MRTTTAVSWPAWLRRAATTTFPPDLTAVNEDAAFFIRYLVFEVRIKVSVFPFLVRIERVEVFTVVTVP